MEPGRRHEADEISIRLQVHDHGWMGERPLPRDNSRDGPAGTQGDSVEATEGAQEVRLEEYRGWSQGMWSRENSGRCCESKRRVSRSTSQKPWRDRCSRGSRHPARSKPKRRIEGIRWNTPGPPVPPAPFGMPYSQVKWGMLPRPKREIPPPKKRAPANPLPAPSRGGWNRGGPN